SLILRSCPLFGSYLQHLMANTKELETQKAPSPHVLVAGSTGSTKTSLLKSKEINPRIEKGDGGILLIDGKTDDGGMQSYTIRRLAEAQWDPAKVFVLDFFSPYGFPLIDFLATDPTDSYSPYKVAGEIVSATALLSNLRSLAGARELDLTNMLVL